ncbi:IQ domain-containing protein iqm2 [Trifolium repens]|nr:IQ domain-containing protein iqm2 [Trifolium repens]
MGISLSCPFSTCNHVEDNLDSIIANSFSIACGEEDLETKILKYKVYKSFHTRRKLADYATLIEQSWWKLLDFAELKRSSISFFDIEKHETAISRWSRAGTRAPKVGKDLSKNVKARKLALLHWLEAIDLRHRYGHNLHFYYDKWLKSQSREPFFYWLDIGEGKEINLEKCPRTKLQQQCIKYTWCYVVIIVKKSTPHFHPYFLTQKQNAN